jgi:hypothetical protein
MHTGIRLEYGSRGGKSIGTWEPSSQKFFMVESFPENFPENISTF